MTDKLYMPRAFLCGLFILTFILFSSCTTVPQYENPKGSIFDLAQVQTGPNVSIISVNNKWAGPRLDYYSSSQNDWDGATDILLLPGTHNLYVQYKIVTKHTYNEKKWRHARTEMPITVDKGKEYIIKASESYSGMVSFRIETVKEFKQPPPSELETIILPASTTISSTYEKLRNLKQLKEENIITDEEYIRLRQELVNQL